ncbi:nicotinamide riboside transporter PnuC [Chitinophaga pinensis]|uniref:Nicotinamide riboside transporter PnuC n=1 Tax=Chitinophaga pinensis (strain ATCC 43595 / DSM 2588 / LMG 13176 / NBRC 15968 / NCIMB 11800 / UQM 2034) TaxID=485918 RepID=A0A979G992_CHIPD|nr:nicotinamide riboside transporter PnuC [Chitinophaga pinensis]ACU63165.1 nicotinamide mononucleotide transporter PnuC [Chitinophaga pinensis DSM 2588]
MTFFDVHHIAFSVMAYPVSYVELIGTLFGLISVYYASRANVLTWPTGIVNEIALFVLFFQVQLYADMLLQVFFLVVTVFGWYNWRHKTEELPVTRMSRPMTGIYGVALLSGTIVMGFTIQQFHRWMPQYFPLPATYPFADSFVMMASVLATFLLAKKRIETWVLWIVVDIVSVILYLIKEIYFLSLEYVVFLGLATFGLLQWRKQLKYA